MNNTITINTLDFRSKLWEPVYQASEDAIYNNKPSSWDLGGGAGSGKTQFVHRLIVTGLLKKAGSIAIVTLYESEHKERITKLFINRMIENFLPYNKRETRTGTVVISFGNNNEIYLLSAKGSSSMSVEEKFKTPITDLKNCLYIWFEEFTAVFRTMKTQKVYSSIMSRLKRQCYEGHVVLHTYNPPDNIADPIVDWSKQKSNCTNRLISVIYKLPPKFQDKETIKLAEQVKAENVTLWRNVYMGEIVGRDGLAFVFNEDIWTDLAEEYVSFHYNTDEATANATAFSLHGITASGEVHFITNYYHSSKVDGIRHAPSYYAKKFKEFEKELDVPITTITTDGIYFTEELKAIGYENVKSIHKIKDRPLSYAILNDLILTGRYRIVNRPENMLMYNQLVNATLKSTTKNGKKKFMVDKSFESSTDDQTKHFHLGDLALYLCLRLQKQLMMGKGNDGK